MKKSIIVEALLLPALIAFAASGCGEGGGPKEGDSTGAAERPGASTPGADMPARPAVVDTGDQGRTVPLDPAVVGSLTLKSSGKYPGEWKFEDVNASMSEQAAGGETKTVLLIEAHRVPPNEHFKLYLSRPGETLAPGTYSIDNPVGNPPRQLDARWEHGEEMFRAIDPAKGSVELKEITDNRVSGTFSLTLVNLNPKAAPATLTGSFDVRLQK